jgi:putative ABC transport system ATP-binding protein
VNITLQDIRKTYMRGKGVPCKALQGVSCVFEANKSYAITGASGSGKSTLLNVLTGIVTPTSGTVLFDEQDVSRLSDARMSKIRNQRIGMIVQNFALLENETALRNCMIPALLASTSSKEAKKKGLHYLAKLDLSDKVDEVVKNLSGGERQRVAIARALMNKPDLVLADEPTGALDSVNAQIVMKELLSTCGNGTTLIVATHNEEFADMCEHRIRLRDGLLVSP